MWPRHRAACSRWDCRAAAAVWVLCSWLPFWQGERGCAGEGRTCWEPLGKRRREVGGRRESACVCVCPSVLSKKKSHCLHQDVPKQTSELLLSCRFGREAACSMHPLLCKGPASHSTTAGFGKHISKHTGVLAAQTLSLRITFFLEREPRSEPAESALSIRASSSDRLHSREQKPQNAGCSERYTRCTPGQPC